MGHGDLFTNLALIFVVGFAICTLVQRLRQPMILGYILTGIISGPVLGIVKDAGPFEGLAQVGVALLLFLVGVELNPKNLKDLRSGALGVGFWQVVTTFSTFLLVYILLRLDFSSSLVLAGAMVFSSTIVGLRFLTEKKEQNRLYGRVSIGILLLQDLVATIMLIVLSLGSGGAGATLLSLVKGLALVFGIYLISTKLIPSAMRYISKNNELLFIFSLAWGLGIAELFKFSGFSIEIGAIVAGVTLASTDYATSILAKLKSVREFFVIIFFVLLGLNINLTEVASQLGFILLISFLVMTIKPISVFMVMSEKRHTKRNSFKAAILLSQISEFSLIVAGVAMSRGFITEGYVSVIAGVTILTIVASSYLVKYDDELFEWLRAKFKFFGAGESESLSNQKEQHDFIQVGWRKGGSELYRAIKKHRKTKTTVLIIDHDPEVIDQLADLGKTFVYGDVTDEDMLEEINFSEAKFIASAVDSFEINKFMLRYLGSKNSKAVFIARAETAMDASRLYKMGASYVVVPHFIGSEKLNNFLAKNGTSRKAFDSYSKRHIKDLQKKIKLKDEEAGSKSDKKKKRKVARIFGYSATHDESSQL